MSSRGSAGGSGVRYNGGHSSSGHGWTAKLVDLSWALSLGAAVQFLTFTLSLCVRACACACSCVCAVSLASVIQNHLVQIDYCRVGWAGWREVVVGVDSLVYRCSAGGSWRRGRARRNAALQRPGAGGDQVNCDARSCRGEGRSRTGRRIAVGRHRNVQQLCGASLAAVLYCAAVLCCALGLVFLFVHFRLFSALAQWLTSSIFLRGCYCPPLSFFLSVFLFFFLYAGVRSQQRLPTLKRNHSLPLGLLSVCPSSNPAIAPITSVKCPLFEKKAPPGMRLLVRAGLHSTHPNLQVHLHLAGPAQACPPVSWTGLVWLAAGLGGLGDWPGA